MCSIVGLQGNFKCNDIIKMLKASKNRGPDSSGVFWMKFALTLIWMIFQMIMTIQ